MELREQIQQVLLQYLSAIHAELIHSHDDVFLTDKILALVKETDLYQKQYECSSCHGSGKTDEPKPDVTLYTLNCDKCGMMFQSSKAFPSRQVCSKCSEPGEGRLLSLEEIGWIVALAKEWWELPRHIAKAQLALCQVHEQATVERIFREIEAAIVVEKLPYRDGRTLICMIPDDTWHVLKDKYLKKQEGIE